jgi:hypothetical protein
LIDGSRPSAQRWDSLPAHSAKISGKAVRQTDPDDRQEGEVALLQARDGIGLMPSGFCREASHGSRTGIVYPYSLERMRGKAIQPQEIEKLGQRPLSNSLSIQRTFRRSNRLTPDPTFDPFWRLAFPRI